MLYTNFYRMINNNNSKLTDSNKLVHEQLSHAREKMKQQYDKSTKPHKFYVGQRVMLWKPYKRSGLSKCFQSNWNGPWVIERFTNNANSNCKIRCCLTEKTMNVHVNQLKIIDNSEERQLPVLRATSPNETVVVSQPESGENDHYLIEFDEENDDIPQQVVNNQNIQEEAVDNFPVVEAGRGHGDRIDNAWVNLDAGNIIPQRTRGVVQDYRNMLAGNR